MNDKEALLDALDAVTKTIAELTTATPIADRTLAEIRAIRSLREAAREITEALISRAPTDGPDAA